ncbi:MAG: hypothetical protein HY527_07760 [Betaproteobacteria bacterium]|nr:hypothetical protein [Betaproteobacteria bacterium]
MESDDNLISDALKLNWDHARHVETLRLRLTAVYILAVLGAGLAALESDAALIQRIAAILGLLISLFCWAMTHKWNAEFVNQIQCADRCARRLRVTSTSDQNSSEELHSYIGFPKPDPLLPKTINVRRMFNWFYITFIAVWVVVVLYAFSEPAPAVPETKPNTSLNSDAPRSGAPVS